VRAQSDIKEFGSTISMARSTSGPVVALFGASGYVGTRVCRTLLDAGVPVTATSRSGTARSSADSISNRARWVTSTLPDSPPPRSELQGASAAVSTVGLLGAGASAERVTGDANVSAVEAASDAGIPRFILVSAHMYRGPPAAALPGYFRGKQKAEHAVMRLFPHSGICLRPGFVYGSRRVSNRVSLPLHLIGQPLNSLLASSGATRARSSLPDAVGSLLEPPVSVNTLASAIAVSALHPDVRGGVASYDRIVELSGMQLPAFESTSASAGSSSSQSYVDRQKQEQEGSGVEAYQHHASESADKQSP